MSGHWSSPDFVPNSGHITVAQGTCERASSRVDMVTRVSHYSRLPASPHPAIAMTASSSKDRVLAGMSSGARCFLSIHIPGTISRSVSMQPHRQEQGAQAEEQLARRVWRVHKEKLGRILPFHDIWAPSGQHSCPRPFHLAW